jgi:hypothetical protein
MPNLALSHGSEIFAPAPDERVSRLHDCARYCRRLARQSDRPATIRSLTVLAAEFEAEAASLMTAGMDAANDADLVAASGWQI